MGRARLVLTLLINTGIRNGALSCDPRLSNLVRQPLTLVGTLGHMGPRAWPKEGIAEVQPRNSPGRGRLVAPSN